MMPELAESGELGTAREVWWATEDDDSFPPFNLEAGWREGEGSEGAVAAAAARGNMQQAACDRGSAAGPC